MNRIYLLLSRAKFAFFMLAGFASLVFTPVSFGQRKQTTKLPTDLARVLDLLSSSRSPLILPVLYEEFEISETRLIFSGAQLGGLPVGELSFDVLASEGDVVHLGNFNFPTYEDLQNELQGKVFTWDSSLDVYYNLASEAPEQINFHLGLGAITDSGDEFSFPGLSMSMTARSEQRAMNLRIQSEAGQLNSMNDDFEFSLRIPEISYTFSEVGYPDDVHPFTGLRSQILANWGGVGYDQIAEGLYSQSWPESYDTSLDVADLMLLIPGLDLNLSVGPSSLRAFGNNAIHERTSTSSFDYVTNDIELKIATEGFEILIGQIFSDGSLAKSNYNAFASAEKPDLDFISDWFLGSKRNAISSTETADLARIIEDIIGLLGLANFQYGASDISTAFLDTNSSLDQLYFGFGWDFRNQGDVTASAEIGYSELSSSAVDSLDPGLQSLLVRDLDISFEVSQIDLDDFITGLSEVEIHGDLPIENYFAQVGEAWWAQSEILINSSASFITDVSILDITANFEVNPFSALGITGTAVVGISNFYDLQDEVSQLSLGPLGQQAASAAFALGLISGFGELDESGTMNLMLEVNQFGNISINGLSLPL